MGLYRKEKLMEVVKDRGYVTLRAVSDAIAPIFGTTRNSVTRKLRSGNLTKEECEVIGSFFQMTMKEYYDVFMYGLFQEDSEGHYRCHIENHGLHLHPNPSAIPPYRRRHLQAAEMIQEMQEMEFNEE